MKIHLLLALTAAAAVDGRLGKEDLSPFPQQRRLETQCAKDDAGFHVVQPVFSAPKKAVGVNAEDTLADVALNLYEIAKKGEDECAALGNPPDCDPKKYFPTCYWKGADETAEKNDDPMASEGQMFPFQGSATNNPLWKGDAETGHCQKVNICHGNAGFGWNQITVDRSSIGSYENGHGGHAVETHNNRSNKRADYFPMTASIPNYRGAGINNGYLDEGCNFICTDPDDTTCQAIAGQAEPTMAPTETPEVPTTAEPSSSPTEYPTPKPTEAPTIAPTSGPTAAPTQKTFDVGSTVEVDGQVCVLQEDCTCEDPEDVAEDKIEVQVASGTKGDPHFIQWDGYHFDFHGGCDLVLVDAPDFNNGQGLKIHIRTKVKTWFSYVERAVVQIGDDSLEVNGGFRGKRFFHNGHLMGNLRKITKVNGPLPIKVGGFDVHYQTQRDNISWKVSIHLPDGQVLALRTIKDYMRVDIEHPTQEYFASAVGLMGSFDNSTITYARDGVSPMDPENTDAFAQSWQVRSDDTMLFHEAGDGPQHPQMCEMPSVGRSTARLLAESSVTYEDAERMCAHLVPAERDDCIYDVIATSDPEIAGAY